ncbi:MAG: flagellar hook assembly protein FlgD, partial [Desulfurivibrionaceae bacterium]
FSNMEATQDMADNLQEMLDYQKSGNNLQLLNLIDKDVAVAGNQIGVSAENRGRGEFVLDDSAAACKVNIYDEGGNPVKSLDKGHLDPGRHDVGWDGTDARGEEVPTGEYHYEVKANDAKGNSLETDTYGIGRVTGVDFNGDNQELTIDKHVTTSADKINKVL